MGVAADAPVPRHFMGTCPSLTLPSHLLHRATWTIIVLLESGDITKGKAGRNDGSCKCRASSLAHKPTHDGTRVKMPRNIQSSRAVRLLADCLGPCPLGVWDIVPWGEVQRQARRDQRVGRVADYLVAQLLYYGHHFAQYFWIFMYNSAP